VITSSSCQLALAFVPGGAKGTMAPEFQRDLRMVGTFHAKFFYFTSSFLHNFRGDVEMLTINTLS